MLEKKMVVIIVAVVAALLAIVVISNLTGRNVAMDIYSIYKTYYCYVADADKTEIKNSVKNVVKF